MPCPAHKRCYSFIANGVGAPGLPAGLFSMPAIAVITSLLLRRVFLDQYSSNKTRQSPSLPSVLLEPVWNVTQVSHVGEIDHIL
jgi:hypothetical protein